MTNVMMLGKGFIVFLIFTFLVGCSNDYQSREKRKKESRKSMITEITLKDGTRCAVLYDKNGYGGMGGISCDWKD